MLDNPLIARAGIIMLPAIWLGLLIGVSFIATPIKFTASSLDLPTALDVGRVTFSLFNKIEWGMLALLTIFLWLNGLPGARTLLATWLAFLLIIQSAWLLPILNFYIETISQSMQKPPSFEHLAYGVIEIVKALSLAAIAIFGVIQQHV
ncbi:MAG TPA: hypothetical protein PLV61_00090 [Parvularculaceae bacterium]|nr:hypothetical protein [Parvularculaceae bacterium]